MFADLKNPSINRKKYERDKKDAKLDNTDNFALKDKNTKIAWIIFFSVDRGIFWVCEQEYDVILMIDGQGHLSMSSEVQKGAKNGVSGKQKQQYFNIDIDYVVIVLFPLFFSF